MTNYILADIKRICRKRSFFITLGIYVGLFLLMIFILSSPSFTVGEYVESTETYLSFYPLVVGLSVFLSVYSDDFKSKSMQVAIGFGIPRHKVVLSKLIESIVLLVMTILGIGVIFLIVPIPLGLSLKQEQVTSLVTILLVELFRTITYIALASILVFYTQNAISGIIAYVLLSSKTIMILLSIILSQSFFINTFGNLTQYFSSTLLYQARTTFLESGKWSSGLMLVLIAYIIVPIGLSIFSFNKKELEF